MVTKWFISQFDADNLFFWVEYTGLNNMNYVDINGKRKNDNGSILNCVL